jgi:hypothetical protein
MQNKHGVVRLGAALQECVRAVLTCGISYQITLAAMPLHRFCWQAGCWHSISYLLGSCVVLRCPVVYVGSLVGTPLRRGRSAMDDDWDDDVLREQVHSLLETVRIGARANAQPAAAAAAAGKRSTTCVALPSGGARRRADSAGAAVATSAAAVASAAGRDQGGARCCAVPRPGKAHAARATPVASAQLAPKFHSTSTPKPKAKAKAATDAAAPPRASGLAATDAAAQRTASRRTGRKFVPPVAYKEDPPCCECDSDCLSD